MPDAMPSVPERPDQDGPRAADVSSGGGSAPDRAPRSDVGRSSRRRVGRRAVRQDVRMALSEHLRELRGRLVRSALALAAGTAAGYAVFPQLLSRLTAPYCTATGQEACVLVALSPLQPFSLRIHGSVLIGLVLAWPVIMWHAWRFIVPGLTVTERRAGVLVVSAGQLLLVAGVASALVLVPASLDLLLGMSGPSVVPMLDASLYLRFLVTVALSFGLLFQLPLVLVALMWLRVLSPDVLRRRRREALVLGAAVAAVVTPTGDAVTLGFAVAVLAVLYELAILVGRMMSGRRPAS